MDIKDRIIENEIISDCISNDEDTLRYLDRVVKITRINRINAANRLLDTENFLQGINIYYSCFSAVLAVVSIIADARILSVWSTILSIILAISIVYLNAQKYGVRSQELKTNYIDLHKLRFDVKLAIEKKHMDTSEVKKMGETYFKLLHTSENHKKIDYLKQEVENARKTKCKVNIFIALEYYLKTLCKYVFRLILILLPLIGVILLAIRGEFNGILW